MDIIFERKTNYSPKRMLQVGFLCGPNQPQTSSVSVCDVVSERCPHPTPHPTLREGVWCWVLSQAGTDRWLLRPDPSGLQSWAPSTFLVGLHPSGASSTCPSLPPAPPRLPDDNKHSPLSKWPALFLSRGLFYVFASPRKGAKTAVAK